MLIDRTLVRASELVFYIILPVFLLNALDFIKKLTTHFHNTPKKSCRLATRGKGQETACRGVENDAGMLARHATKHNGTLFMGPTPRRQPKMVDWGMSLWCAEPDQVVTKRKFKEEFQEILTLEIRTG